MSDVLERLAEVLEQRRHADPQTSYVASLYASGLDKILEKVGEEAVETIIAAKNGDPQALVHEVADLWFHSVVLLAEQGLTVSAVLAELERRSGVSGLEEKAARAEPPGRHG